MWSLGQIHRWRVGTPSGGRASLDRPTDPWFLAYLIGPPSLLLALTLQHFGLIAHHSVLLWVVVFVATPIANLAVDIAYRRNASDIRRHLRLAVRSASVTAIIYLTGWGPALICAYSVGALESISQDGSRIWKATALWSMLGIATGQALIAAGIAPSFLDDHEAQAVGVMSTFLLLFVVRIGAATVAKRETAEGYLQSRERLLRDREEHFRSLIQQSTDLTLVATPELLVAYASPAAERLLGMTPSDLIGTTITDLIHPDDFDRVSAHMASDLERATVTTPIALRMLNAQSRVADVEAVVTDLRDNPAVGGWVVNIRDITERRVVEEALIRQAHHDSLTGLPNRTVLLERADRILSSCRQTGRQMAILFVDIDNFKDINDTLGHEVGDEMLQIVARRLSARLRGGETIGRMGGDEFVVLVEEMDSSSTTTTVAERLHQSLEEPIRIGGVEGSFVDVTISIGVAEGSHHSAQELLRDADVALYQAKLAGRDRTVSFLPEMHSVAIENLQLRSDLKVAQERGEFLLLYQPIFDLKHGDMIGVEALVRWRHPTRGVVPPDEFIPVLEQTGHIVDVGGWVLETACSDAATWWAREVHLRVAVNTAPQQLEDQAFVEFVSSVLSRSGLPPEALVIEITETSLMRRTDVANRHLEELKALGIRVAIDDFGTGYSSLSYLLQFPVDVLKIDRSFINAVTWSAHAAAVTRTILQLGKTLGIQIVAEGIEDSEQLAFLRAEDCLWGQGFLYSRPVRADEIGAMLDRASETSIGSDLISTGSSTRSPMSTTFEKVLFPTD